MDFTIFQWINGLAGENRFLDGFMMFMTDYGPYGFALILFLMVLNWFQIPADQRALYGCDIGPRFGLELWDRSIVAP